MFAAHGITLFDVEEIPTHGGSLRIFGGHAGDGGNPVSSRVSKLCQTELAAGLDRTETYTAFAEQIKVSNVLCSGS